MIYFPMSIFFCFSVSFFLTFLTQCPSMSISNCTKEEYARPILTKKGRHKYFIFKLFWLIL